RDDPALLRIDLVEETTMSHPEQLFLLRLPDYSPRIVEFLHRIDREPALSELFTRNPVGVLQEAVFPERQLLPADVLSRENRLLFALLSNRGFRDWAKRYQTAFEERAKNTYPNLVPDEAYIAYAGHISREEVYKDIAEAALSFIDRETLYLLIQGI